MSFKETHSDFYQYLNTESTRRPSTINNYISWLNFLYDDGDYVIDEYLTEEYIDEIISWEDNKRNFRKKYTKQEDISNFRSALRSYSDFLRQKEEKIKTEIDNIQNSKSLSQTEKDSLIKSRLGQGKFRRNLIIYWQGCAVSSFLDKNILVASHIKPWKDANNDERMDTFNGLLLLPHYDKLFDKGYISFDDNGNILISKLISANDKKLLGVENNIKLTKIEAGHKGYLSYHREKCYIN